MAVKTYIPQFTVIVYKAITRADNCQPTRLQGGQSQPWSITEHLGDGSEISVSKSVTSPKGSFVITVPDRYYKIAPDAGGNTPAGMDTLYGLLEPMDEIEIRLARNRAEYPNGLPLLMRGFIRTIRRVESMGSDGKPQRSTVIQGNDYGWIFEMTQIPPLVYLGFLLGTAFNTAWEIFFAIGENQKPRTVGEFFKLILEHVINAQLVNMKARFSAIALYDPKQVKGKVVIPKQDALVGPIWNTFLQYADLPWNELWVEDPETTEGDPPRLRFRPAPYRTWIKGGTFLDNGETIQIMGQTSEYEKVEIWIEDVVRLDVSRSEQDVANIYWVDSPELVSKQANKEMQNAASAGDMKHILLDGKEYPNSDPDLYSYRVMNSSSALLSDQQTSGSDGQSEKTMNGSGGISTTLSPWVAERRKALVEMNCDNVLLEEGSMTVKGNEKIRAGKYVVLHRGTFGGEHGVEYYAQTVTHKFAPYRQYTTTINFIRGTGFIERVKMTTDSPYLQEGKQGVYE
jgi:hypothetical protein